MNAEHTMYNIIVFSSEPQQIKGNEELENILHLIYIWLYSGDT